MKELRISRNFVLPLNAVTEVFALLATRGAGKSYGSADFIEELHRAHLQFVVIDPMGVFWGLRSGADGNKKGGLPIVLLGGEMGDVPLEPTSGKLIADVVVDTGQSLVLDLSYHELTGAFESKAQQTRFVTDFAERLFTRKSPLASRSPLMLVIDEADEFAPQRPGSDETKMLGAIIRIAKRGRTRGIGLLSLTQRSAEFSKAVLDLSSAVVFMRTAGPRDRKAIRDWFKGHDEAQIALADTALPKLDTGEAIIYSPQWLRLEEPHRMKFRPIRTFDSYKTPEPGEEPVRPRAMAEIDLTALGEQIAATAERAKEFDPTELQRRLRERDQRIRELERRLEEQPTETEPQIVEVEKIIEVPIVPPEALQKLDEIIGMLREVTTGFKSEQEEFTGKMVAVFDSFNSIIASLRRDMERAAERPAPSPAPPPRSTAPPAPQPRTAAREPAPTRESDDDGRLDKAAVGFLETLARCYPMRVTIGQLGILAGKKTRGGSYNTAMKQIRAGQYIEESGGKLTLSERGLTRMGVTPREPHTPEEKIEVWRQALPEVARLIFDELIKEPSRELTLHELGERTKPPGVEKPRATRGGSWNFAVATLVNNELAEKMADGLRLSDALLLAES